MDQVKIGRLKMGRVKMKKMKLILTRIPGIENYCWSLAVAAQRILEKIASEKYRMTKLFHPMAAKPD